MVKGTTETGFAFSVNEKKLNDAEFLELFARTQKADNLAVFELIEATLGAEQKKALYEHCRDKDGIVPVDKLSAEIGEIFKAMAEHPKTKN